MPSTVTSRQPPATSSSLTPKPGETANGPAAPIARNGAPVASNAANPAGNVGDRVTLGRQAAGVQAYNRRGQVLGQVKTTQHGPSGATPLSNAPGQTQAAKPKPAIPSLFDAINAFKSRIQNLG
ncbi:hypothetical protein [Chitinimonas sp.]|uniref:hypothetical protein n=1 Tax=Chitinimonas sp. TaxID=1934313 RepID=UPI0035B38F7B